MMQSFVRNIKATRVSNAVAAGSTDIECSIIDMQGFDGVSFEALFGAITSGAATGLKVEQGDAANLSDGDDLEGSAISIDDDEDNMVLLTDIFRPTKRYVRPIVTRATQNAVVDGVMAHQYGASVLPVTQDATTIADSEFHASPDEGTA